MIGLAGKRHLCDSVLLSNTWLFHMRVGCRAVQTRLSWITPRWEAICTGLLTTILRRQVQDGVGVVAVVWHIQMDVISCQNIALFSTLFHFLCDCSSMSQVVLVLKWPAQPHVALYQTMRMKHCIVHSDWNCEDCPLYVFRSYLSLRFGIFGKPGFVR